MDHAVVIGASVSGLLSAAALHRLFAKVTVLDRDTLPAADGHRKGTGQSRHAHGLLSRGLAAMDELLPGLSAELVAQGALRCDPLAQARNVHGGRRLARDRCDLDSLLVSRPLLEGQIRRRVAALPGVRVLAGRGVTGLLTQEGRVTGVRLAGGEPVPADLVVDAAGRGSRVPIWLGELGHEPPREERVELDLRYGTREFRRRPGEMGGDLIVIIGPTPERPRFGVALALEDDRWIVTLGGYGESPGLDLPAFAGYAATLPAPDLCHLLATAEPIGEPRSYRTPAGVRRRYERLARFPEGLLVTGDAVCAFNPLYGQGMTVAALEAKVLLEAELTPRAFFRRVAGIVDGPWEITVGGDLKLPVVAGEPSPRTRLVNAYLERYLAAAAHDPELARRFLRVAHLYDPPPALMSPPALLRVLRSGAPRAVPVPA
ncbi:tryptophan 7-halogenase [Actinomadura sp. ATCC 31491]|uniref:Tryptophan 7-halogenase n=1 Tax=Actinomadura luzonensis TaxID=2805427 RepID=A0ABT0G7C0_9ACTN|nr:tryptophan 7-halogenase [Actinomadura luzonensis]MCK2220494.1 tryptophan 7-halogenase [Actinomadura luzonensis]